MINWKVSEADMNLIRAIVERIVGECPCVLPKDFTLTLTMDLNAVHANGCPLDLKKLLEAPKVDFVHDICGIQRHLDRNTGKLRDRFDPRCSMPERKREGAQPERAMIAAIGKTPGPKMRIRVYGNRGKGISRRA